MQTKGEVVQVQGGVVDCEFPPGELPEIYDALEISKNGDRSLILEVQRHLGDGVVRTVAMDSTYGLMRGTHVRATGAPLTAP
ncbi:MAG: F0F1 ATP synthase subunit beta, partial [Chloroflexi bacterium]|nr:F0F1 ATP synthase subunit beta [Chloroflexota bacterium]